MTELAALAELLSLLLLDPRTGVLLALLLVAAVIDWKTLRIPNWLTVGGMVVGWWSECQAAATPTDPGSATASAGWRWASVLLLPLYGCCASWAPATSS